MYDWLPNSIGNSGTVVTANRRLARILSDEYASRQLAAGEKAWSSPAIFAWQDWLAELSDIALEQEKLPTRINAHQSQVLWERCLLKEIDDSDTSITTLVRLSRETRQRLADWQVSIGEVARMAQSDDHRVFASVSGRFLGLLEHENWVDDAGLAEFVLSLIVEQKILLSGRYTFAGFERQRPILKAFQDAMTASGVAVSTVPNPETQGECVLGEFETTAAELRAAGAWARERLEKHPEARIAIIANGLDKEADSIARHVREGVTPGWQHGHSSIFEAVNVSYGQRLSDYPAIAVALLLLRWLVRDVPSGDVSLLLRSALLGATDTADNVAGRSRLELKLRQLPDRKWSPSMITAEFRGRDDGEITNDWISLLAAFSKRRRELPKTATPAAWAEFIDEILRSFNWPGPGSLDSAEFQLINRWRELLNEFARLGLVCSTLSAHAAIARVELMASETVFQPESGNAAIQLMGALEASGSQFDGIWISGVSTANWPPAGTPSAMVSRRLQEKYGMPDCTPADTYQCADQVLRNLIASAKDVVCSFALTIDDAEQTASELLTPLTTSVDQNYNDPGWYAATLRTRSDVVAVEDIVPVVTEGEKISGGAGTMQRQILSPISAFVHGRMGARVIYPQAVGIPAPMRGNLIHDALYKMYLDLPASREMRMWVGEELDSRIAKAIDFAFGRHEKNADAVLQQLLLLERSRIAQLLRQFVAIDSNRDSFRIAGVEGTFEFVAGHIRLPLRFDRIDEFDDGTIAILDYKTGTKKTLLNRDNEAQEIQLFVYASATDAPVSALALVNVDSREIAFEGAGRGFTDDDEWPELLSRIKAEIAAACMEMSGGDVRVNIEQGIKSARPLNLLTRYTELRRDHA